MMVTVRLRFLLGAAAALALAAAIACGDDDGGGGGPTLDPAKADEIAHQVLLDKGDLPGKGWVSAEEDSFEEPDNAASKACDAISEKREKAKAQSDPAKEGRAQRKLEREGPTVSTDVDVQVSIFKDAKAPTASIKLQKEAYDANLRQCFEDTLKEGSGPSLKIDVKDATLLGKLPGNGVARAIEVKLADEKESIEMRLETYNWQFGNAGVSVNITGPKDDVTAELVKAALDKVQANLEAAAKK